MKTFRWTVPEPKHFSQNSGLPEEKSQRQKIMRSPLWVSSLMLFAMAFLLLTIKSSNPFGVLFFVPFTFSPMIISLLLGLLSSSKKFLGILLFSNLAYFLWFLLIYRDVFYIHPDPQASIAFLFTAFYSLPVMLPLWGIALLLRKISVIPLTSSS